MADKNDGDIAPLLQCLDQGEDLGLYGHIERGGRFITDQQFRFGNHRHRDHYPLAHPSREFVRVAVNTRFRVGNTHFIEHRYSAFQGLLTVQVSMV